MEIDCLIFKISSGVLGLRSTEGLLTAPGGWRCPATLDLGDTASF